MSRQPWGWAGVESGSWVPTRSREKGFCEGWGQTPLVQPSASGPSEEPCGVQAFLQARDVVGVGGGQGSVAFHRPAWALLGDPSALGGECPRKRLSLSSAPGGLSKAPLLGPPSPAGSHLGPGPGMCMLNQARP